MEDWQRLRSGVSGMKPQLHVFMAFDRHQPFVILAAVKTSWDLLCCITRDNRRLKHAVRAHTPLDPASTTRNTKVSNSQNAGTKNLHLTMKPIAIDSEQVRQLEKGTLSCAKNAISRARLRSVCQGVTLATRFQLA